MEQVRIYKNYSYSLYSHNSFLNFITFYSKLLFLILPLPCDARRGVAQGFETWCGYFALILALKGKIYTALILRGLIP